MRNPEFAAEKVRYGMTQSLAVCDRQGGVIGISLGSDVLETVTDPVYTVCSLCKSHNLNFLICTVNFIIMPSVGLRLRGQNRI